MLAQVILVMRTPFKGQGAIWAQEGTHASMDTLMNLDLNIQMLNLYFCFFKAFICLLNIMLVEIT